MSEQFDRLKAALADRYAVQEELGAGGMATVYLAEDLKHHRKVAVKVLRPELAAVLGAERFVKEIETTAITWTRRFWEAMQPFTSDGVYVNYLGEEGEHRVKAAYAAPTYERLVALKNRYDPTNLFRLNRTSSRQCDSVTA